MSNYGSDQVSLFLLGGYDILGTLTEFDVDVEAEIERTTVLGNSWETHGFVGIRKAEIQQDGFYDDGALSVARALLGEGPNASGPGLSRVLCLAVEGTATGKKFLGMAGAIEVKYEIGPKRGELTKAKANYKSNGIVEQGAIIRYPTLITTTGGVVTTGSPVDAGASNTSGGAAYLQVTKLDGWSSTGITVSVLDSPDNITYSALAVFGSATLAPYAERLAIPGVIQRYVACSASPASWAGANTSQTFFVGLVRK